MDNGNGKTATGFPTEATKSTCKATGNKARLDGSTSMDAGQPTVPATFTPAGIGMAQATIDSGCEEAGFPPGLAIPTARATGHRAMAATAGNEAVGRAAAADAPLL